MRKILYFSFLAVALASQAPAQSNYGAISGNVRDAHRLPVAAATVQLTA